MRGRVLRILVFPTLLGLGLWFGLAGTTGLAGHLPECQFHERTGWHCPGCGGTRSFLALARGDLPTALRMNPLGTGLIIYVALLLLRLSWEAAFPRLRWRRFPFSDRAAWGVVAGLLVFAVLRNLPWWPFTLLAPP